MANLIKNPASIQKEIIPFLHYPKTDVLASEVDRGLRKAKLAKATTIGNLDHTKVKIIFEDIHGLKSVETTIWATTQNKIVLKKGSVIPINRIHDIRFV